MICRLFSAQLSTPVELAINQSPHISCVYIGRIVIESIYIGLGVHTSCEATYLQRSISVEMGQKGIKMLTQEQSYLPTGMHLPPPRWKHPKADQDRHCGQKERPPLIASTISFFTVIVILEEEVLRKRMRRGSIRYGKCVVS